MQRSQRRLCTLHQKLPKAGWLAACQQSVSQGPVHADKRHRENIALNATCVFITSKYLFI